LINKILHRIKKRWQSKTVILMYHRIDETPCDPWELAVHPKHFEEQLQFLKQHGHVVSMEELTTSLSNKTLKNKTVALTFDDGYLDNFTQAAPLLDKYRLPATFYITTGGIGTNDQFWWDELQDLILLNDSLPKQFHLTINDENIDFDLGDEHQLNQKLKDQIKSWNAEQASIDKRTELYFTIWKNLRVCEPVIRKKYLQDIRNWAGKQSERSGQMMNWEQVQSLSKNQLFSIGGHTVNHPALGAHPINIQKQEIVHGADTLRKMISKDIMGFAYPHGNYNHDTISILKEVGFNYAVTTESTSLSDKSKQFELPRFQVKNWNGNDFIKHIQQWQTGKA
jgi:peptidoglycan/xylan/chitin deacetylase (PgdA/CDA1 family)